VAGSCENGNEPSNKLITWSRVAELADQEFPAFYETKELIIVLTRAGHWSLALDRFTQFIFTLFL